MCQADRVNSVARTCLIHKHLQSELPSIPPPSLATLISRTLPRGEPPGEPECAPSHALCLPAGRCPSLLPAGCCPRPPPLPPSVLLLHLENPMPPWVPATPAFLGWGSSLGCANVVGDTEATAPSDRWASRGAGSRPLLAHPLSFLLRGRDRRQAGWVSTTSACPPAPRCARAPTTGWSCGWWESTGRRRSGRA